MTWPEGSLERTVVERRYWRWPRDSRDDLCFELHRAACGAPRGSVTAEPGLRAFRRREEIQLTPELARLEWPKDCGNFLALWDYRRKPAARREAAYRRKHKQAWDAYYLHRAVQLRHKRDLKRMGLSEAGLAEAARREVRAHEAGKGTFSGLARTSMRGGRP
ncbi:MAG: hypothetical protein HY554_15825 [Elusimicrobia bacterium]|nr:hypothetical protein [Elusimicrobiota bacterium]